MDLPVLQNAALFCRFLLRSAPPVPHEYPKSAQTFRSQCTPPGAPGPTLRAPRLVHIDPGEGGARDARRGLGHPARAYRGQALELPARVELHQAAGRTSGPEQRTGRRTRPAPQGERPRTDRVPAQELHTSHARLQASSAARPDLTPPAAHAGPCACSARPARPQGCERHLFSMLFSAFYKNRLLSTSKSLSCIYCRPL